MDLEREHPGVKQSMLKALGNVMPRHLLDTRLNPSGELRDSVALRLEDEGAAPTASIQIQHCTSSRCACEPSFSASPRRACASATASSARSAAACSSCSASAATTAADDVTYVAGKIRDMRVFEGDDGKPMDRSVADVGGGVLVVSQFTLYGDCARDGGRRSTTAAPPEQARALYEDLVRELRAAAVPVATGEFQAMMQVELVNDGPVTMLIDSKTTVLMQTIALDCLHRRLRVSSSLLLSRAVRRVRAAAAARHRRSRDRSAPAACSSRRASTTRATRVSGVGLEGQPAAASARRRQRRRQLDRRDPDRRRLLQPADDHRPRAGAAGSHGRPPPATRRSSVEDIVDRHEGPLRCPRASARPAFGVRFATKLPNASNESGLGLDTTDFFASVLVGEDRPVGPDRRQRRRLGILGDPTRGDRQNDVLTYGVSFARALTQAAEVVGEINGRVNTRDGEPPPGTESRSVVAVRRALHDRRLARRCRAALRRDVARSRHRRHRRLHLRLQRLPGPVMTSLRVVKAHAYGNDFLLRRRGTTADGDPTRPRARACATGTPASAPTG